MFTHIVPKFEKGRILKTGMLENLRDYPRSFLDIRYQDYSDGIIAGTNVSVREDVLCISPGIIKYAGRLYLMEEEQEVPYAATGREMVLKVRFEEGQSSADFDRHAGTVVLEENQHGDIEQELARFKLKEGAVLRSGYIDFADLSTEYNTLNFIRALHAGCGGGTLSPIILKLFARELIGKGSRDPLDLSFALLCLNEEKIELEAILHYLAARSGSSLPDDDPVKLHQALVRVLEEQGGHRSYGAARNGPQRMLVD
ncbi:hypothetical protein [Paenibacillus durus]|uniref:DNA and RNA helicase n=1 Tax=Paenibacillus durus TaxID=44251 RepID=A0A089HU05_PAEDU|nr:hypothetical protein [Paenibacillus durus]AIQ14235.1 DNA and RNA helicase [Paenibacillus durus]